jgi:pSer/pThr/pTyr-binding forkhead associated (FHA) protein
MEETDKLATGRAIILELVRAMRTNVEPLLFTTVAPTRFFVYLHPSDHQRLEGIVPAIVAQARRALDEEVRAWNARAKPSRIPRKWLGGDDPLPPIEMPPDTWDIRFEADDDGEMAPGDIAIASELTLPARPEFDGSKTRRITTMRLGERTSTGERAAEDAAVQAPAGTVFATLAYEDARGRRRVPITSPVVVVGRGGVGYWVDVKLDTSPDVSREHLRLRRDDASGQFFLKDLSSLGTTVDGVPVPSSVEVVEGRKRDKGIEVPVPPRARIGLANVIVLDFEAGSPRRDD